MKRVGIYSGSFNPVHTGHIALCDWLVEHDIVDEVWLIRSPLNPLKAGQQLAPDADRQAMLERAIAGHRGLEVCTIEDNLPRPNYTICTLRALESAHETEDVCFSLIIGADNWLIFDRWRAYDEILSDFGLIVYPRPGYEDPESASVTQQLNTRHVTFVNAPQYDISSTQIRDMVARGELPDIGILDPAVTQYILDKQLYASQ